MTAEERRQELIAEATKLGLSFQSNISTKNLETKVREAQDALVLEEASKVESEDEFTEVIEEVGVETEDEMRARLEEEYATKLEEQVAEIKLNAEINAEINAPGASLGLKKLKAMKRATKLIRCVITNRNPMKQSWDGEIITVSNDMIGIQRKFVPFSLEEGYHLPKIIIDTLRDKECSIFVNGKSKNGEKIQVGKLIKEYAIEVLPQLTREEIEELAGDQRARNAIDES